MRNIGFIVFCTSSITVVSIPANAQKSTYGRLRKLEEKVHALIDLNERLSLSLEQQQKRTKAEIDQLKNTYSETVKISGRIDIIEKQIDRMESQIIRILIIQNQNKEHILSIQDEKNTPSLNEKNHIKIKKGRKRFQQIRQSRKLIPPYPIGPHTMWNSHR